MSQSRALLIALRASGRELAERLAAALDDAEIAAPAIPARRALLDGFHEGRPLIFLGAAGIAMRILGPELHDKGREPPVVVIAEDGSCVIPLLGGHRGANDLAARLSTVLGVAPAITTAGDLAFGVALDDPPAGWHLANPGDAKAFMAALLDGARIHLVGEAPWLAEGALPLDEEGDLLISTGVEIQPGTPRHLVYHPARLVIGVGCARGCAAQEIRGLIETTLNDLHLSPLAVAGLFSVDLKADEVGLHQAAVELGLPVRFFDHDRLAAEDHRLVNPSDVVKAEIGLRGVAEAAALAAVGEDGMLLISKRKSAAATCAIGMAPVALAEEGLPGRRRGSLAVVGVGPGDPLWRTAEATARIRGADLVIGYGLYLDLVSDLTRHAETRRYELGAEEDRVRDALATAATGRDVALVCSGDAGIYAMASLVWEILDRTETPDAQRRVSVVTVPGISAMQAAAARIGAPLGHDFCAISLSDLLTPRDAIIGRLEAAAAGDFVVALYNPVSRRRRDLLDRAREILLRHRPATTPVVIARNLGREGEHIEVLTLDALKTEAVDMLSLVIIGSSRSRAGARGGAQFVYTPRGYLDDRTEDAS